MDRQGRAPALIARSRSRAVYAARFVVVALGVAFAAASVSGCRNKKEEARQKAELTKNLAAFKLQIVELQKQAAELHARFDKLPEDLPGIGAVRDDLYAIEEGLGVEDGRTKWLSGQLDKAFASGRKEEIEAVRNAIPPGDDATAQAIVRLAHELGPLERLAAQRSFFESLDAAKARDARNQRPPKAR